MEEERKIKCTLKPCRHSSAEVAKGALELYRDTKRDLARTRKRQRTSAAKTLWHLRSRIKERALEAAKWEIQKSYLCSERARINALKTAEDDCLRLILEISYDILQCEIDQKSESIRKRVKKALIPLKQHHISITTHPKDVDSLKKDLKDYTQTLTITGDSTLERGNACVTTKAGTITLDWKHHFELMRDHLLGAAA